MTRISAVQSSEPDASPAIAPDSPDRFINRELSWLDFNHRVRRGGGEPAPPAAGAAALPVDQRQQPGRILFSVRVAGLIGQAKAGIAALSADGRTPAQQLAEIQVRAAGA